jgi:glucosamine-6-phosphate isomerase
MRILSHVHGPSLRSRSFPMKITVYPTCDELSIATADQIVRIVREKDDALLCFPAGETSLGTFARLAALCRQGRVSFARCRVVGLDEWVGLGPMARENCRHFLAKHLIDHLDLRQENIRFFDGEAGDLRAECNLTDRFVVDSGGIDMMLLGVGMNGHLGLNEPGAPFDASSHVVELDETTRRVGQKYFSSPVRLSRGVTLGLKQVLEARTLIVQMSGLKKAPVARRLVESEVTPEFPASITKHHSNSHLLLDADAASDTGTK